MDFKSQIIEDIRDIQSEFPKVQHIDKDEWVFNFWILDKIFRVDEELIPNYITDYNDQGVDSYYFFEDAKELYIIQNKFYDSTPLTVKYLQDDFLIRPLNLLKDGNYKRNQDLQKIFNKYKNDKDFTLYLEIYVTNNTNKEELERAINQFNSTHINDSINVKAKIYMLDDIKSKYYDEVPENKINFKYTITTINKGTILRVDPESYKLDINLNARYILVPVTTIYKMYREAKEKQYPIFDANIREYLGLSSKINKKIEKTLKDEKDRNNFFYYNNGITIVCKSMGNPVTHNGYSIDIENPQIVNGCQTVSTIYETLDRYDVSVIDKEFEYSFVLVKLLEIGDSDEKKDLYKNIVEYNNSQNSIDEKTFVSTRSEFMRLQNEFMNKGLLLLVKQSDKNKFGNEYKNCSRLLEKVDDLAEKFELKFNSAKDLMVDLSKLLQVVVAFTNNSVTAYQKKSKLLDEESDEFKTVLEFLKSNNTLNSAIINLYLFYLKLYKNREENEYGVFPIPYFAIDLFSRYECDKNANKINEALKDKESINRLYNLYKLTIQFYTVDYAKKTQLSYNTMVKQEIDYEEMKKCYEQAKMVIK